MLKTVSVEEGSLNVTDEHSKARQWADERTGREERWVDRQRRLMRRLWWGMVEPKVQLIRAP